MATSNPSLVRDNSTLTNFKAWAKAISDFFGTAGWVQSADTGQVNWSSIASVPTAGNYVYEIWKTNDGLTTIYWKMEYGTNTASGNTGPSIRVTWGTGSNGVGALTGFTYGPITLPTTVTAVSSTATQWQCYFSGDSGRMNILMWRDESASGGPAFVGVQRSMDSSGVANGAYFTVVGVANAILGKCFQATVHFANGVTTSGPTIGGSSSASLYFIRNGASTSENFGSNIAVSPIFPAIGYFDNPHDAFAIGSSADFTEGATYTLASANMPYGVSRTYIATKTALFSGLGGVSGGTTLLMRFD